MSETNALPQIPEIRIVVTRPDPRNSIPTVRYFGSVKQIEEWSKTNSEIISAASLLVDDSIMIDGYIENNWEKLLLECKYMIKKFPIDPNEQEECQHYFEGGSCIECGVDVDWSDVVNKAHEISDGER